MSGTRQKVDAFFNPAPGGDSRVSAAKMLDEEGLGFEDDGEHMNKFFDGSVKTASAVEVNKRSILADIQLDSGAYQGKKVSRSQLAAMQKEASDSEGFDEE